MSQTGLSLQLAIATVTAVTPPGRWGAMAINGSQVSAFIEKPAGDAGFINGGFFVLNQGIFDYLTGDDCVFEKEPLERLAANGQLSAYVHRGFWQAMDTLRDKNILEEHWSSGHAPWKQWA
jgi:glucose-1-phosphate cytidylyltransferase